MRVIAIHGSPRPGGCSDLLLAEALRAAADGGHSVELLRPAAMSIHPCKSCGGCSRDGVCVIDDAMQGVFRLIRECDRIIIATPVFFSGVPAQLKALIDRGQALWSEKYLLKRPIPAGPFGRKGLLIVVGGQQIKEGFGCVDATARAFLRSASVPGHETLTFGGMNEPRDLLSHPTALKDVYDAAARLFSAQTKF